MERIPMTRDGFLKMIEDFNRMKNVDLKECLQNLHDARDKGDISENSEYEVAKQSLEDLNKRVSKLGKMLNNAQIIEGAIDDGTVQLLTYVRFKNIKTKIETEWRIVPETEINIKEGKISPSSPIGKALMNKRPGEKVTVDIPAGKIDLEILNVRCK
jgi:transcription elongation factor GreA